MIELIEQIGPILGLLAFVGLIVLAYLIFGQARDIRRLRDWAGRAPERSEEAAEASLAAQEARNADGEPAEEPVGRFGRLRAGAGARLGGARSAVGRRWASFDRRLPFDGRLLLGALVVAVIAAIVITSGFGLIGGGAETGDGESEPAPEVAILNATQTTDATTGAPVPAVEGLAKRVANRVVKPTEFEPGVRDDAETGAEQTVIMFDSPGDEPHASELADEVAPSLGEVSTTRMSGEVSRLARKAPLAIVIGQDNSSFGESAG